MQSDLTLLNIDTVQRISTYVSNIINNMAAVLVGAAERVLLLFWVLIMWWKLLLTVIRH